MSTEWIVKHFNTTALNFPDQFEEVEDRNVQSNLYVMRIRHKATGIERWFPYRWSERNGQVTWGKWFCGGCNVGSVAYVSRGYSSFSSAKRAALG